MASKRSRRESTSMGSDSEQGGGGVAYDDHKFISLKAQQYFHSALVGKNFVLERGLMPDRKLDGHMASMIRARGWNLFCEDPMAAPISVVQEFYANAKFTKSNKIFVRGCEVSFAKESINELFNLPNIALDAVDSLYAREWGSELDAICNYLCMPGTTWKLKQGTDQKLHFPQAALSRYGKAWYSFICANLMPTRHQNEVTKDRAVLLYGIVKGKKIDLGYVINSSIRRFLSGGNSAGIPHASVITRLCAMNGVVWNDVEPMQMPMSTIDHPTIESFKVWNEGKSHPQGAGFILPEQREAGETSERAPPAQSESSHTVHEHIDRMERRLQRRMDAMSTNFQAFTTDFCGALSQAFDQMGVQVQFPTYGSAAAYPPPDTPPEQADEEDDEDDGDDEAE